MCCLTSDLLCICVIILAKQTWDSDFGNFLPAIRTAEGAALLSWPLQNSPHSRKREQTEIQLGEQFQYSVENLTSHVFPWWESYWLS